MRYIYPAVFTEEEKGYSVLFPDLEGCYTCGDDLSDALYMAEDVLAFTLFDYEKNRKTIPEPSDVRKIETDENAFVSLVACDTLKYHQNS